MAMANDPRWVKDINIDAVVVAFTNLLTVISGIAPVTTSKWNNLKVWLIRRLWGGCVLTW